MKSLFVLVLALFCGACDDPSPVAPSPLMQTPAPPPVIQTPPPGVVPVRDVTLGERVEGIFGDGHTIQPPEHHFSLPVPGDGTLEVTLEWDPHYLGTLLMLTIEGKPFGPTMPGWSPVVGRLPVQAGRRYLIVVGLAGADWLPEDRFVLTSRLAN